MMKSTLFCVCVLVLSLQLVFIPCINSIKTFQQMYSDEIYSQEQQQRRVLHWQWPQSIQRGPDVYNTTETIPSLPQVTEIAQSATKPTESIQRGPEIPPSSSSSSSEEILPIKKQRKLKKTNRVFDLYALFGLRNGSKLFKIPGNGRIAKNKSPFCGTLQEVTFQSSIKKTKKKVAAANNNALVNSGQIPWQVGIFVNSGQFLCSGVLVSPKHVVTSAVCFLATFAGDLDILNVIHVKIGAWHLPNNNYDGGGGRDTSNSDGYSGGAQGGSSSSSSVEYSKYYKATINKIILYPEMNVSKKYGGGQNQQEFAKIALLELSQAVDFGKYPNIQPICLNSHETKSTPPPRTKTSSELPLPLPMNSNNVAVQNMITIMGAKSNKKQAEAQAASAAAKFYRVKRKHFPSSSSSFSASSAPKKSKYGQKASRFSLPVAEHDNLECYVSGWGKVAGIMSVADLHLQQRHGRRSKRNKRSAIGSEFVLKMPTIIIPFNTAYEFVDSNRTANDTNTTANDDNPSTVWEYKPVVLSHGGGGKQQAASEAAVETIETTTTTSLTTPALKQLPNLDPIQDYLDSLEERNPTTQEKQGSSEEAEAAAETTKNPSSIRKKQLKPFSDATSSAEVVEENEGASTTTTTLRPNYAAAVLPFFQGIESDELSIDTQEAVEQRRRQHISSASVSDSEGSSISSAEGEEEELSYLQWAYVNLHNISAEEARVKRIDVSLGSVYVQSVSKALSSSSATSLCMVDLGSPVICNVKKPSSSNRKSSKSASVEEEEEYVKHSINQSPKFLAGIVTWKMPCSPNSPRYNGEIPESVFYNTNYNFVQVTPIHEFKQFLMQQHVPT